MNITELLPIGTVVMLKGGKKPLMIFGVKQITGDDTSVEYDYIGVIYPEGNIGEMFQYLFNHEDITKILFTGYETEERKNFLLQLEQEYKNR